MALQHVTVDFPAKISVHRTVHRTAKYRLHTFFFLCSTKMVAGMQQLVPFVSVLKTYLPLFFAMMHLSKNYRLYCVEDVRCTSLGPDQKRLAYASGEATAFSAPVVSMQLFPYDHCLGCLFPSSV